MTFLLEPRRTRGDQEQHWRGHQHRDHTHGRQSGMGANARSPAQCNFVDVATFIPSDTPMAQGAKISMNRQKSTGLVNALSMQTIGSSSLAEAGLSPSSPWPGGLVADLRTDHAGETGAVMIYRGILATTQDATVRRFAHEHLATEANHLAAIEQLLAPRHRSCLLRLWRGAGWLTGALPALIGPRAVYATIEAVETFVDHHYSEQLQAIDELDPDRSRAPMQALRALLQACRADEISHRDEAAAHLVQQTRPPSLALRLWVWAVGAGSRAAVTISRRV